MKNKILKIFLLFITIISLFSFFCTTVKAEEGTSNRLYQEMWNEGLENFTFQVIEICNKDNLILPDEIILS